MAAPPPTEAELTRSATTVDSLPDDILAEVLLRVPTPAALVHAAAASRSWRGAISNPVFLARYRKRHKSSPFLGLYVPRRVAGPPSFQMADSIHCAGDDTGSRHLKDAALKAFNIGGVRRYQDHRLHDAVDNAFILGPLPVHPDCRLLDCHNSRLLLTKGDEALEVRSPLARESILLPFPSDVVHPYCLKLEACLLQGRDEAAASFRVVYLQHRRKGRNRQARAVEYDSSRKSWQDHPWETLKGSIEGAPEEVMHAGHRMFCRYNGRWQAALMLDTMKMEFSVLPFPTDRNFAIGEIEDDVCCLVETDGCADHRLRVWQLDEKKLDWELKKDVKMDQVLGEHVVGYYRPRAISNGIALVCSTTTQHHFVVDLNTCSVKEKFEFHGQFAYLMQMPWPPAFAGPTANAAGGVDRDGEPAPVSDARTVAGESDEIDGLLGGASALAEEPMHVDPCQTRPEPSPSPSLGCCFSTNPEEAKMARLLYLSSIACSVPGTSCRNPDASPATAPPTELLITSSPAEYMEDRQRMALTTAGSPSCPQHGRKLSRSRESKGSPEAMGPQRCNWKRKPKYLEAIFALRRHHSFSIASKISDEVQIATSSCREASAASTAAVSDEECKLLFGGSGSTIKFTDSGKQPIIDVSITSAPSLFDPSAGESAEQRAEAARDCAGGKLGRDVCAPMPSNEPQDLDIQDPTATAPTSTIAEQNVPNDYLIPDLCGQFSDLVRPKGSHHPERIAGGSASVSDDRTGSGELDAIEGLFGGTLAIAPPAAPAVEPEEPLSHAWIRTRSLNHDLLLQPLSLASCPQQGRKLSRSRESKGSPEAVGLWRHNWKRKPKYLEAIFALRRHHSFSIASKIPDLCGQFSDLVHPKGGPTSVSDDRTGSGELDAIGGLFGGTLAMAPPAALAVEPEEPLSHAWIRTRSLNHDLLLRPLTLASCPQQGGKLDGSRGGKGSPGATMGRGRRQKMTNPKYLGGEWLVVRRRLV